MSIAEKTFNNGEVIIKEGDIGNSFFQLVEGTANVFANYGKKDEFRLAMLEAGEFFGEMAIIESYPRNATIVANSRIRVIEIPGNELNSYLAKNPDMTGELIKHLGNRVQNMLRDYEDAKNLLKELRESDAGKKGNSFFSKLKKHINTYQSNKDNMITEPSAEALIAAFDSITDEGSGNIWAYDKDMIIFKEGEFGDCLYILRSGTVGLYKNHGTGDETKTGELQPISVFGEMGIISDVIRDVTAVAEKDETYIEVIYQKDLDTLIKSCPVKIEAILRHLSFHLRKINYEFLNTCKEITETYDKKK